MAAREGRSAKRLKVIGLDADPIAEFLASKGIRLQVVSSGKADLMVSGRARRREGSLSALYPGGRIKCAVALALAKRLGVPPDKLGGLLDFLGIKVHRCSLGLFR